MKTSFTICFATIAMFCTIACKKESVQTKNTVVSTASASNLETFVIGQEYGGGIIIYIDSTGQHGIIAAKTDQSLGSTWYNGVPGITGATGKILGTGPANTRKIVRVQGEGIYAASVCSDYKVETFNDWYLPSKNELLEVYKQKAIVSAGDFVYWSSTEVDANAAWAQNLTTGGRKQSRKDKIYHVRAVRTF